MSRYYNIDGEPISMIEWAHLLEIREYAGIREDYVGGIRVSTVWLGLDHSFFGGPPIIFETIVFGAEEHWCEMLQRPYHEALEQNRYSTLAEAVEGHERLLGVIRELEEIQSRGSESNR